jgi:hypothetical protein
MNNINNLASCENVSFLTGLGNKPFSMEAALLYKMKMNSHEIYQRTKKYVSDILEEGYIITEHGDVFNKHGEKRKLQKQKNGYLSYCFYFKNHYQRISIHRIVASLYIDNPKMKMDVNHIDGNKTNNFYKNLEWLTRSENQQYSYDNGSRDKHKKQVYCLDKNNNKIIMKYNSMSEASRSTGTTPANIWAVIHNYRTMKTAGGYKWKYVDE